MAKAKAKKKPAKTGPGVPTVERKIHFYRIHSGTDEAGKPLPFDPIPALQHIHSMPFDDARYMPSGNGAASVIWIDDVKKHPHVRMGDVRRNGLPSIDARENLVRWISPTAPGLPNKRTSSSSPTTLWVSNSIFTVHALVGSLPTSCRRHRTNAQNSS